MDWLVILRFKAPQYPNCQDETYLKLKTFTFLIFSHHMRYRQDSRIQLTLAIPQFASSGVKIMRKIIK